MPFARARSCESGFGSEHPPGTGVYHEGSDPETRGAEPDLTHHLLLELQPRVAARYERRPERDDGRAVDVVVHHGLGERLY
jgi:hypothetical protein